MTALLDLLRLVLPDTIDASPGADIDPEPTLSWRLVLDAWHSPYFDWSALPENGASGPIGITPEDADALDAAARWGHVVGGLSQWEEILADLATRPEEPMDDGSTDRVPLDEEPCWPDGYTVRSFAEVQSLAMLAEAHCAD